jgi:hypothetical protein
MALVTLYANAPVSNGQLWGHAFAVAVCVTPPDSESLLKNSKVLFTPITSFATSGENAVVVRPAAPGLIWMVTQAGGVHETAAVVVVEGAVLHDVDVHTTNW